MIKDKFSNMDFDEEVLNGSKPTETERIEAIAKELGIEESVADDIDYLRCLERRIVTAAKKHSHLRDFPVYNEELEDFISIFENDR